MMGANDRGQRRGRRWALAALGVASAALLLLMVASPRTMFPTAVRLAEAQRMAARGPYRPDDVAYLTAGIAHGERLPAVRSRLAAMGFVEPNGTVTPDHSMMLVMVQDYGPPVGGLVGVIGNAVGAKPTHAGHEWHTVAFNNKGEAQAVWLMASHFAHRSKLSTQILLRTGRPGTLTEQDFLPANTPEE